MVNFILIASFVIVSQTSFTVLDVPYVVLTITSGPSKIFELDSS